MARVAAGNEEPRAIHKSEKREQEPQESGRASHVALFSHLSSPCTATNGLRLGPAARTDRQLMVAATYPGWLRCVGFAEPRGRFSEQSP